MRRMTEDGGEVEHAISPAQLAGALAVKIKFETGLLAGNTLYIVNEGTRKAVVEYRPPQKTALYLEGSDTPLIVPLPGLVMDGRAMAAATHFVTACMQSKADQKRWMRRCSIHRCQMSVMGQFVGEV